TCRSCPLPLGEGGAAAPGEGGPPHDLQRLTKSGAGCPHPALPRHLLPEGEGHASFSARRSTGRPLLFIARLARTTRWDCRRDLPPESACRRDRLPSHYESALPGSSAQQYAGTSPSLGGSLCSTRQVLACCHRASVESPTLLGHSKSV